MMFPDRTELQTPVPGLLYSTDAAARFLGVSKNTLIGWRVKREGPRFVKMNRLVRYRGGDLLDWVESLSARSA